MSIAYLRVRTRECVRARAWMHAHWSALARISSMQRAAILSFAASLAPLHFLTLSHKLHDFLKKRY
jgi:hypothetical protein